VYLTPRAWQESDEFRCDVPLIFFHVVEIHLPIRVCMQFGRHTGVPPPLYSTNQKLHRCIFILKQLYTCDVCVLQLNMVLLQGRPQAEVQ
jgi:hypothetical protein